MWKLKAEIDDVESWAYLENAFSKEECENIIKLGETLMPTTATILNGECLDVRDSKVSWITPSKESEAIFRKVTDIVVNINKKFFNFELEGFAEGFQFTKYEAPSGKYDLHIDKMFMGNIRKLSVVIQLSDPNDYEGGELKLQLGQNPETIVRKQGFATLFPSYVLHGVTPVTKGTRYSLVAWITGPAFK